MESIITMDQVGRLVLPGRIRKALQVSSPAAFKAEVMGNKVELTLIAPETGTGPEEETRPLGGFHRWQEV